MGVFTLRSLVLRGVSVVRDGQNVGLRLGAESKAFIPTAPETRITPPNPTNCRPAWMQAGGRADHAAYEGVDASAQGAGRLLGSSVGSLRFGPARSAGRTVRFGWSKRWTPKCNAAKRLRRSTGKRFAAGAAALGRGRASAA
jgi:hypothetical protein